MNIQLYCTWFIPCLSHTHPWNPNLNGPGLYQSCTGPVGHSGCAHCAPVSFCLGSRLGRPFCWVAHPPAFFTCHLRPTDGRQPKAHHAHSKDDIRAALVFYSLSTFEKLVLPAVPGSGQMEKGMCRSITILSYPGYPKPRLFGLA